MPALVSLKMEPKEAKQELLSDAQPVPPQYHYGFTLSFDKDVMDKLNMKDLPEVGRTFEIEAVAKVVAVRASADQQETRIGFDLQITDIALTKIGKTAAERIYGAMGVEKSFDAAMPEGAEPPV